MEAELVQLVESKPVRPPLLVGKYIVLEFDGHYPSLLWRTPCDHLFDTGVGAMKRAAELRKSGSSTAILRVKGSAAIPVPR